MIKMTNYERIKEMSIDELAQAMGDCAKDYGCYCCPFEYECIKQSGNTCKQHIKSWLESEVTEWWKEKYYL